jgi:hypothetical protein
MKIWEDNSNSSRATGSRAALSSLLLVLHSSVRVCSYRSISCALVNSSVLDL